MFRAACRLYRRRSDQIHDAKKSSAVLIVGVSVLVTLFLRLKGANDTFCFSRHAIYCAWTCGVFGGVHKHVWYGNNSNTKNARYRYPRRSGLLAPESFFRCSEPLTFERTTKQAHLHSFGEHPELERAGVGRRAEQQRVLYVHDRLRITPPLQPA